MRWFRNPILIVILLLLASCGIPGPQASDAEIAAIRSNSYTGEEPPGIRIYARIAGDPEGRRVIFIHGTPGNSAGWADFLLNVPPGLEFVAPDRPGFGQSGPKGAIVALGAQASALAPLLVERNGQWPVLVGHSLGAPIAARMAIDYPDRVGGLVLVAGSMDPALEEVKLIQYVAKYMGLDRLIPRRMRNANRELIGLKPQLESLQAELASIHCPVAIVHGTEDPLVPYANVAFMQREMTNAEIKVTTLRDRNHFLPWHSKNAIDSAIRDVLGRGGRTCGAAPA